MNTGILVLGYVSDCEGWENIAWGIAPKLMGQIPTSLFMALRYNAKAIVYGPDTHMADGVYEVRETHRLLNKLPQGLAEFDAFQDIVLDELTIPPRFFVEASNNQVRD